MSIENFNTIEYSDISKFESKEGRIELKEYKGNMVFYVPFDSSLNAKYFEGIQSASVINGTFDIMNFGVFAQHLSLNGTIKYDKTNFVNISNEGNVSFRVRTGFNNGYGYCDFINTTISPFTAGTYKFKLVVNSIQNDIEVALSGVENFTQLFNAVAVEIIPSMNATVLLNEGRIRIQSTNLADSVEILPPTSGLNLITLLGGVSNPVINNAPSQNAVLLSFNNGNNNSKLELSHLTTGHLNLKVYDKVGVKKIDKNLTIWSNSYLEFYTFELNWNKNLISLFVDGILSGLEITNFERDSGLDLYISSGSDIYKFDELIICSKAVEFSDHLVATSALTRYSADLPYIDINFGKGFKEQDIEDIFINCTSNCHFVLGMGLQWFYFLSNSWSISNGSFNQSNDPAVFESKFNLMHFNEELDLKIRIYFESDGERQCSIDEIRINKKVAANKTAILVGAVAITAPIDFTSSITKMTIVTDQGSKEVDVTKLAADITAVTIEEIKNSINDEYVPGLKPVRDDGFGHLVFETTTMGDSAFITVKE